MKKIICLLILVAIYFFTTGCSINKNIIFKNEITKDEALKLANQKIQLKIKDFQYDNIDKIKWDINKNDPFPAILRNDICPEISDYKQNKIWKAEKEVNIDEIKCNINSESKENVIFITYVGIDGKLICNATVHQEYTPGIGSIDDLCK